MRSKKPLKQRLEELHTRQERLKEQEALLRKRYSEESRKERAHRLVSIGAAVEQFCGEIADLESFKAYLMKYAQAIKSTQPKNDSMALEDVLEELNDIFKECDEDEEFKAFTGPSS